MHWMYDGGSPFIHFFGFGFPSILFLVPFMVWILVWKGWALWLAARRNEMPWFIGLLILNTAGILEIFYIFLIAKRSEMKEHAADEK